MDQKYEDESEDDSLPSMDGGYKGIHINFPLTNTDLDALIDTFRKKKVSFCFTSTNVQGNHCLDKDLIPVL